MSNPRVKRLKTTNAINQKKDHAVVRDLVSEKGIWPQILSFVGDHQYRFIGAVNHAFQEAYLLLYPDCKKTYYNVSSIQLAEFCWNDFSVDSLEARYICEAAAKRNLTVLKHAMKHYEGTGNDFICDIGEHLCAAAAGAGRLPTLQWLHLQGCEWDEWTFAKAAAGGHLNVLKWCFAENCVWDWRACADAAAAGRLNVLKWLRSKDCPWCPLTCAYAAMNGHLHILKWAHKNGCDYNEDTCIFAYDKKQWKCFNWAVDHGFPVDEDYFEWDERSGSFKRKDVLDDDM